MVEISELKTAIAGGETLRLELKEEPRQEDKRDLCKEVAALASMGGGRLVIGASDAGVVLGVENARELAGKVTDWVGTWVAPAPTMDCEIVALDGLDVIVFTISPSLHPLFYYKERAYIRVGTYSRPPTPAQAEAMIINGELAKEQRRLGAEIIAMRGELDPAQRTAAAILGQGELATMNYGQLLARLRADLAKAK